MSSKYHGIKSIVDTGRKKKKTEFTEEVEKAKKQLQEKIEVPKEPVEEIVEQVKEPIVEETPSIYKRITKFSSERYEAKERSPRKEKKKPKKVLPKNTKAVKEQIELVAEVPKEPAFFSSGLKKPDQPIRQLDKATTYSLLSKIAKDNRIEVQETRAAEKEQTALLELAQEAQRKKEEIQDILELHTDYLREEEPETVAPEEMDAQQTSALIERTAEMLASLQKEDVADVPVADINKLQRSVEIMQRQFGELNSIGWGQRGMTYGSGEVRLEFLDDIDRSTAKINNRYLRYNSTTDKWEGATVSGSGGNPVVSGAVVGTNLVLTLTDSSTVTIAASTMINETFNPSGFEYVNDSAYASLANSTSNNGLEIEDDDWVKIECSGSTTDKLPEGTHGGIAGSGAWAGSGSTTYSRIYNTTTQTFHFDELSLDTVVNFRVKVDVVPELNNTIMNCRINFEGISDGTDAVILEDGDDIGLETATPGAGSAGDKLVGDYFTTYQFYQTVSAQELTEGAGVEDNRTYIFPIYVGDADGQRGKGFFELQASSAVVVTDTSILAALN